MSNVDADKIKAIIAEQISIKVEEIVDTSSFADLGFDSLDTVELVMKLEEELDIEIPDSEAEKLKTVKDVIDYVTAHKHK
jgi:acyl carrier protein